MSAEYAEVIAGCPVTTVGDDGPPVVLLTGPPAGRWVFLEVQRRMAPLRTVALDLFSAERGPLEPAALTTLLAEVLRAVGARAVCAHGLAVPIALALTPEATPLVVLTNGPVDRLDPVTRALSALPEATLRQLFRPAWFRRWLRSSLGLRRLVANPYVMDHDTVVALSESWVRGATERAAAARWVSGFSRDLALPRGAGPTCIAIWGDSDPLYPLSALDGLRATGGLGALRTVPGGRHFHPLERPWALADVLLSVVQEHEEG